MKRTLAALLSLGLLAGPTPTFAHHSTSMYNMANPITITGTVKSFEWTNPHAFIYLDVKGEDGKVVVWQVEMMSLNHLKNYGWMRTTVKPGDVISCTGGAAKSGDPAMISSLMKLADGRMIKS
jgi:WD40 repeat protein